MIKRGGEMKKVLISACLLGEKCRYDGKSKPNESALELLSNYHLVPVCPEVLGGLSIPRKPSEIKGERVVMIDGTDVTCEYRLGAEKALKIAKENGITVAVLKARSPSCGKGMIYDGTYTGTLTSGNGITVQLFLNNGIKVYDETEIDKIEL